MDRDFETTTWAHQLFAIGLCSKEASAEAMVYSYKHGFTGFAAKLTGTQAQIISGFF